MRARVLPWPVRHLDTGSPMRWFRAARLVVGWLLIAPPDVWQDGAVRRDEHRPLWTWQRLGAFPELADCRRARDARIARAQTDDERAAFEMARCVDAERAEVGRLRPGEYESLR